MDKEDSKKSALDHLRSFWGSLPEAIKLLGTILSIAIALKILFPAAAVGINSFDAGPEVIEPGELSVLNWEVSGAANVTIEPDIGAVNSSGSLSVSPSETTTYKLIASGDGEEKVAMCTVTVKKEDLLISSFDASPNLIKPGESAVLNWHVAGVSNVTIEPDIGTVEPTGTLNVSPADTASYKLTASNGDKEDVAYCTVTVKEDLPSTQENSSSTEENVAPPAENLPAQKEESLSENLTPKDSLEEDLPSIITFNADPDVITKGESSNLIWNVSEATEVFIEPGVGTAGLSGSQRMFPNETTTYTLTATNKAGSVSATKIVNMKESSMPTSSVSLSTPEQISPVSGEVFDNSTTQAVFKWKAVSGASNYTVEVDSYDSTTGKWLSESSGSDMVSGISGTSYSFGFLEGIDQYRWRVWAVSPEGMEGGKSDWWTFSSQPGLSTESTQTENATM
jgi:hypothetical protein